MEKDIDLYTRFSVLKTLAYVLRQVIKFPFAALIMSLAALAIAAQAIIIPLFTKKILDIVSNTNSSSLLSDVIEHIFGLIFILAIVEILLRTYSYVVGINSIPRFRKNIVEYSVDKLFKKSYNFYKNERIDFLRDKVVALGDTMPDLLEFIFNKFLSKALIFLLAILLLWHSYLQFALLMLTWTCLFVMILVYYIPKIIIQSDSLVNQKGVVYGRISDTFSNILSVRLFHNWHIEKKLIGIAADESMSRERRLNWTYLFVFFWVSVSFISMQVISLLWLIEEKQAGTITIGDFGLILATNYSIVDVLWNLMYEIISFLKALAETQVALNEINCDREIHDHLGAKDLKVTNGSIVLRNVHFGYKGDCSFVLNNLSCEITGGQKIGLVGMSGSGKSTFYKLLLRLYDVNSGTIEIDDQDISSVTQDSLRSNISVVSQDINLFNRSLMENIRYGNASVSDEEVIFAAKKVYADSFISKMPHMYDSVVGEMGVELSGGQRQLIILARAFLKNSPILILDEPTSNLDSITERLIQQSLSELMHGKTSIVIAHKLSTLLLMDRIFVFDKGRIVEDGTHCELLKNNGLYRDLWDTQVDGFIEK